MSKFVKNPNETLKFVKREAKRLRNKMGISLSEAQESLAKRNGFQSFHELNVKAKKVHQPKIICFDIETEPFSEHFRKATTVKARITHAPQMRLACIFSPSAKCYKFFTESESKLLVREIRSADIVISYNGKCFDELVLRRHYGLKGKIPINGKHVDLFEIISDRSGYRVSLNVAAQLNLGERKHTDGRKMVDCSMAELRSACQSDVSQTYRLWKLFESGQLETPSKRFRGTSEEEVDAIGQFLPEDEESELDELFDFEGGDPFEEMTEGQFADAMAGFR